MDRSAQKIGLCRRSSAETRPEIYDLTRIFIDEAIRHPFARHDDLIDAAARIYDIDPHPPVRYERQSTMPLGLDDDELRCESLDCEGPGAEAWWSADSDYE